MGNEKAKRLERLKELYMERERLDAEMEPLLMEACADILRRLTGTEPQGNRETPWLSLSKEAMELAQRKEDECTCSIPRMTAYNNWLRMEVAGKTTSFRVMKSNTGKTLLEANVTSDHEGHQAIARLGTGDGDGTETMIAVNSFLTHLQEWVESGELTTRKESNGFTTLMAKETKK